MACLVSSVGYCGALGDVFGAVTLYVAPLGSLLLAAGLIRVLATCTSARIRYNAKTMLHLNQGT